MRKFLLISLILLTYSLCLYSQNEQQLSSYIENIVEQVVGSRENADIESIVSSLEILYQNPININNATLEELEKLWILNDFQINALLEYRKEMHQFVSIHELRYIFGFNDNVVDLVTPFIYCGTTVRKHKKSFKEIVERSRHQVLLRASYRNTISNNYLGSPIQQYTRYTGDFSRIFRIGFLAEKDAGEPFGKGVNQLGYDFYSGFIQYNTKTVVKNVTLGDYRVRLGQGLLIWNGYSSGKSSEISTLQKRGQGIRANTSKDEYNFMRGVSVSLAVKDFRLLFWGSVKKLDGTMNSVQNELILQSINKSGYHRTESEMNRKFNIDERSYGGAIQYKKSRYSFGINYLHTEYAMPIQPTNEAYKKYSFSGRSLEGFSADYKVLHQNIQFYGEAAYANNAFSGITGIYLMPNSRFTGNLLYRYYQPKYFSPYANGLVESGEPTNEQGFLGGIKWYTDWKVTVSAYADIFSIPWLSFNAISPSKGSDYLVELNYAPARNFEFLFRYKLKEKEKNYKTASQNTYQILPFKRQSLRLHARYNLTEKLTMASRFEWAESGYTGFEQVPGYLIYQDISYHLPKGTSFYIRYARFDVKAYDSRIYAYENDVLFAYSMPAYYDKGQKFYLMFRQKMHNRFIVWLRYANTSLFEISTVDKHEFRGQIMIKF